MRCRVCGREFDPRGFQVVVPGLGMGFDRVECALEASATGVPLIESPPPLPIAAPRPALALPAVVTAGAGLPAAGAASARPPVLVGANLALLAAGTATTIYLWMRVFSPDAAFQPAPAEHAAAAFARSSVSAEIDLASGPTAKPQPEVVVFDDGEPGATGGAPERSGAVAVSSRGRATTRTGSGSFTGQTPSPTKGGGSGGPVVRPTPPPAPPPPPEEPPPPPPRQTPTPAPPVPTSPPGDRVPGAPLPGPGLPDSGPTGPGGSGRPGS
jgi:hypothetical protein